MNIYNCCLISFIIAYCNKTAFFNWKEMLSTEDSIFFVGNANFRGLPSFVGDNYYACCLLKIGGVMLDEYLQLLSYVIDYTIGDMTAFFIR